MTEPEHKNELEENDEENEEEEEEEEVEEEEPIEEEVKEIEIEVEEEEEEEEEEEGVKHVKKRKCVRRKKGIKICFGEGLTEEEEEICIQEVEEEEAAEEEEQEEEEGEYDGEISEISIVPSILSAVLFEWENEQYEFEELCDPGTIKPPQKSKIVEYDMGDLFGVTRYKEMCHALNILPMSSILRALKTEEMDLSFRNLDTKAIKAITAALNANFVTKRLILKWSDLKSQDCFNLGRLMSRNVITYLDFTGCRLGSESLGFLIAFLMNNEVVSDLILSRCNIGDEGMKTLAYVLTFNNSIENLDLSYNKLDPPSAESLALVFMSNSSLATLNLRYNNLFEPSTMKNFFRYLAPNTSMIHLNLSWNGLNGVDIGVYIGNFLRRSLSIRCLDLSDNRLEGLAIIEIKNGMQRSRSLGTLKLGKNPLSSTDIEELLWGVKYCRSVQTLDLEDVWIDKNALKTIQKLEKDRGLECKYAGVLGDYEIIGPDYPKLILRRAQFEAQKPKQAKKKKDFGHLMWTLGDEPMTKADFMARVKKFKAKITKELFPELMKQFQNPKNKMINVTAMREKYLSIFPDSSPPPPPKPKKGKKDKEVEEVPAEEVPEEEDFGEDGDLMLGESAEDLFTDEEGYDEHETEEEEEEEEKEEGGEN